MQIQVTGFGPNGAEVAQVDPTTGALRASLRPIDWTPGVNGVIGGHYRISTMTGTMAAGIASLAQVFQVRWADPVKMFLLERLTVQCSTGTGFAATTLGCPLQLIVGHGSTANGSGGTALAPNSVSNKMRPVMASTAFAPAGEIRVATTGALTAATSQTLEAAGIGICMGAPNATLAQSAPMDLFNMVDEGSHPLVLQSGDTLAVRTYTPAATGTWFATFTMEWIETVNY